MQMIAKTVMVKEFLDSQEKYRELLFKRGYFFTDSTIDNLAQYPFYGLWSHVKVQKYNLYLHQDQTCYLKEADGVTVAIVGHAYNPFDMQCDENALCEALISAYKQGKEAYFDKVSELTGLHVIFVCDKNGFWVCQDACGLTCCYFGKVREHIYITEYPQLVADLCGLHMDSKVEKLVTSKCYNIGNRYLPGNVTPYKELKRLGANTYLQYTKGDFSIVRFYPLMPHPEYTTDAEIDSVVKLIAEGIHNGIRCATQKWDRVTVSLSGGTDSKTTLACANGIYDQLSYFSFHSKPQELVDAKGAKKICEKLGLEHTLYTIPGENSAFENFEQLKMLISHNTNYFVNLNDNEIRKFLYLHNLDAYDIECKSWASEVTRVFFERKYKIKMPKVLNERMCSVLQTRFFGHPLLLRWSDKQYYAFLKEVGLGKALYNYEHADMIYWEARMSSWGASVVSSQNLFHRVTMPMNNRKILEMFLSLPRELRKTDEIHKRIMAYKNQAVVDAEVEIPNLYFHSYRIWLEKVFFYLRTMFYIPKK